MQVSKWGNSLAVRLPVAVVEALGLKEDDEIEIEVAAERQFAVRRRLSIAERLERLRNKQHHLPRDFRFSRDAANER